MYSQTHDIMNKSNKNNNLRKFVSWSRGQATRRTNTNQNQERTIVSKQWRPSSSRANLGVFCIKPVLLLVVFSFFCTCVWVCGEAGLVVAVALNDEAIRFFPTISSAKRASKALNMEFMVEIKDDKQYIFLERDFLNVWKIFYEIYDLQLWEVLLI